MNEFTGKFKEQLRELKIRMESYKNGCEDTFILMQDIIGESYRKCLDLWDKKIRMCDEEMNKETHESDN